MVLRAPAAVGVGLGDRGRAERLSNSRRGAVKRRSALVQSLTDRIVGALHLGQVRTGDRLPSIRQVAHETGRNARTVARAYAELEAEGLVEVRGRSGVFTATQETLGGGVPEETASWMSGVVVDAWRRRIPV